MSLTDAFIKKAKTTGKVCRLADADGLYLLLNPSGSRCWRFDYRHAGKRKTLSMGTYPETGLGAAREKRDEARKLLAAGIDPGKPGEAKQGAVGKRAVDKFESKERSRRVGHALAASTRRLEVLGIDDMEERAYCALLSHHLASVHEVAALLSQPSRKVQNLLDSIEAKGLATHSPEQPPRYIATAPELAVEALIRKQQVALELARLGIPELKKRSVDFTGIHGSGQDVQLIANRDVAGQIFAQFLQTIESEIVVFQRAPMIFANYEKKKPNVNIRTISDEGFLAMPGGMNLLRLDVESGEEARIYPALPMKMTIADRRLGIIPLNPEDENGPILLVRSCALLDALYALFELTWERSTPLVFTRAGKVKAARSRPKLSEAAEQLIPLLSAGLNDKTIAHRVGASRATLNRRIAELMKYFDTRTRFQLGLRVALGDTLER